MFSIPAQFEYHAPTYWHERQKEDPSLDIFALCQWPILSQLFDVTLSKGLIWLFNIVIGEEQTTAHCSITKWPSYWIQHVNNLANRQQIAISFLCHYKITSCNMSIQCHYQDHQNSWILLLMLLELAFCSGMVRAERLAWSTPISQTDKPSHRKIICFVTTRVLQTKFRITLTKWN